jgi:RND family efflux transporter MFP subunit
MNPQATETESTAETRRESHIPPMGPRRRSAARVWAYTVPAVILAAFGGLAYWRVQSRNRVSAELIPAAAESEQIPVAVAHPARSTASRELTIPGDVQAYVETPIYARTDGYLKQWNVDIGGHVKRGELLATIDTPELDQQLRQAEAAQLQAQANLDLAKTTAERWHVLLKSDGVSQQEVDSNDAAYKARQADFATAVANVDRLRSLQSFQQVLAPFDGVITTRDIDIGALITNGTVKKLFKEAQVEVMRVYTNVPEGYSNDIYIGMAAELRIGEFPNRVFAGKVAHTSGAIDTGSRTLLTEVQVPNPKGELKPGAYAEVTFRISSAEPPLVIPSNTLIFRSAGPQVGVVDSSNTARLRNVTIGRDFGTSLEILSGLQPRDLVVLNPPDSLSDGDPVSIQQTDNAAPDAPAKPATATPNASGKPN